MNRWYGILILSLFLATGQAQDRDSLTFKGQLIAWTNLNPSNDLPVWLGVRYLPQFNYNRALPKTRLFDVEASANLFGTAAFHPFESLYTDGAIKPYRLWARYSSPQFEFRLGLQKINFGAASLLRPLMWFDQIDPAIQSSSPMASGARWGGIISSTTPISGYGGCMATKTPGVGS